MDPVGVDSVDDTNMGSGNLLVGLVGEKRLMEGDDDDLGVKKKKKARVDSSGDMKRVAEIVLVLSALGKIRGGRNPTDVEKGLMVEARKKLTEICETISPNDIIPSDAIRVVTEDLGLNKTRDQRLGFRPPKMSIAEKFLLAKRKMEESKKFAAQSTAYPSQRLQTGVGAKNENHNTSIHTAHRTPPEKPSPAKVPVGVSQAVPPIVHVTALASTSTSKQLPANEVQPATVSRGLLSTSSELKSSSSVLPRVEGAPFRLNGSVYTSHVQANSSVVEKTPTVSPQLQPGALVGQANKVPTHIVKVEGASETTSKVQLQVTRDQTSKPPVVQTAHGNVHNVHQPSQATNATSAMNTTNLQKASSLYSNHSDIAKNVQKLLQPRILQRPNWTPPSTDYMSKSVTCQICKVTINDVESLLVCDACEKGVHLKCLQSYNHKGIPMGEWHCPTCLISSNGKPLPPKYGRVTRNMSAPTVSPNKGRMQVSSEKVENPEKKVNNQKVAANGDSGCQNLTSAARTANNHTVPIPVLKASNAREVVGANFSPIKKKMEDPSPESRSVPKETTGTVCAPPSDKPNDSSVHHLQGTQTSCCPTERSISEIKSLPKSEPSQCCPDKPSDMALDTCSHSEPLCNLQNVIKAELPNCAEVSANQYHQVNTTELRATLEHNLGCNLRQDNQDIAQTVSVGTSDVGNGAQNCTRSLDLHSVDWVGDILQVVDEKAFYKSCQIKGIVYNLQDHALFHSNSESLRPSKLQALWEDTKTGSKWAIVNRCYMPDDLPEVVGRPCTPENNEVYESNHGSTVRASLIQGPCDVLSSNKFKKENERRIHLENQANDGLQPVFLCKWFYDESKGLFRPVID